MEINTVTQDELNKAAWAYAYTVNDPYELDDFKFAFEEGAEWLEKKSGMVVMTKEEFEKAIEDAWDAGMKYGEIDYGVKNISAKKEQYLTSILNTNN